MTIMMIMIIIIRNNSAPAKKWVSLSSVLLIETNAYPNVDKMRVVQF